MVWVRITRKLIAASEARALSQSQIPKSQTILIQRASHDFDASHYARAGLTCDAIRMRHSATESRFVIVTVEVGTFRT